MNGSILNLFKEPSAEQLLLLLLPGLISSRSIGISTRINEVLKCQEIKFYNASI